jgi:hypothetical protein
MPQCGAAATLQARMDVVFNRKEFLSGLPMLAS